MKKQEKILIVDDDELMRHLLNELLAGTYHCDTAIDLQTAYELLNQKCYELVMTDIMLPDGTGIDLIDFVHQRYPTTATVAITGVGGGKLAKQILDIGVCGYIVKPFERSQILITAQNALRLRKLEIQQQEYRTSLERMVEHKTKALSSALADLKKEKAQSDQVSRELQKQLSFMNTLINAIQNPIYYKDREGVYLGCNEAFTVHTGRSVDDIIGKTVFDIASESTAKRHHQEDMDLIRNPGKRTYEATTKHQNRITREEVIHKATFTDAQGDVAGIVSVILDITDRKQMEARLAESELRFKTIWNAIQTGVLLVDEVTRQILDANPQAEAMIGLPKDQISGHQCHHFVCPSNENECPVLDLKLNVDKKECSMLNARGETIPIIKTVTPTTIGERRVLIESFLDISQLKKAERNLEKSHREIAALIGSITSVLIGLSPDMKVIQWNTEAEKVFNIPSAQAIGVRFWDIPISWDWPMVRRMIGQCAEFDKKCKLDDLNYKQPGGKDGFLELRLNAVDYDGLGSRGILIMGSDITQKKLLESQLTQAQKLESIGQLAAGIAHEINTPTQYVGDNTRFLQDAFSDVMAVIESYDILAQHMKDGDVTESMILDTEEKIEEADVEYLTQEIPTAFEQTLDGIDRITSIVHSMKEFSHPGVDEKTPVNINNALNSTITVARNEWKYVAEVETDFESDLPVVPCLPGELNQVFLNIIINAAHAIQSNLPEDSDKKGQIRITTCCQGDSVEVRISDTGCGIPEEIQHRIFDPFFTTKEVGKGTGQGLAIAHRVITEQHGGTLRLETEMGHGTTFIITLPMGETASNDVGAMR